MDEKRNTGVIIVEPDFANDFVAGGETGITPVVRNTSSDWRSAEPPGEWQKDMASEFETDACVSFSADDALESFGDFEIARGAWPTESVQWLRDNGYMNPNGTLNFSDRFTAKMSGTTPNGNSLPAVANSIRKNGLVPETVWPFPIEEIAANPANAWNIYYAPVPASVVALGQEFLKHFSVNYEWVFLPSGIHATIESAREALKVSPLQIATEVCWPWNTDVVQACGPGAQHATTMTYADTSGYKILDHYTPFDKTLSPDYDITYAMRYVLSPVQVAQPAPTTWNFRSNLSLRATGPEVSNLQHALQTLKDAAGNPYMKPGVFGPFGPQTQAALARFQADRGIIDTPMGSHFGPKTRAAMQKALIDTTPRAISGYMKNGIFTLDYGSIIDALVLAVVVAVLGALVSLVGSGNFDVFTANWLVIGKSIVNLGFSAAVLSLGKDFLSTNNGSLLGITPANPAVSQ